MGYAAARTKQTFASPRTISPIPPPPHASTTLRVGPYVQYYKMLSE